MKIHNSCFGAEIGSKVLDTKVRLDEDCNIIPLRGKKPEIGTVVGSYQIGNYDFIQVDFHGVIKKINIMDDAQCLGRYRLIEEE